MHYFGESYWGMHFIWWIFWVFVMILIFSPATPISRGRGRQTPLQILQRRYAASEITSLEYEERKAILERDTKPMN